VNDVTLPGRSAAEGDAEARRCALDRLRAAQAAGLAISPLIGPTAAALGVAPRTLWRWLGEGLPGQGTSRAWQPTEADEDAYLRWKGNAAASWRERRAAGDAPGLRTFQAALVRRFQAGERAALVEGVEGRRRHQVYLRWEPEARNELWETDHKELDVPVLFPRAQRPRKPWSTLFVDGFSRAVMGWAIADRASTASVLAALGEAVRVDPRRGPFGGLPAAIRPDGGLEFAAGAIEQACAVLAVRLAPVPPYSPHLKGKVERLHGTIVTALLAELPHFSGGPRDAAGGLRGGSLPVLSFAELVARIDAWVLAYNLERPHEGLDGGTPLERWREDATPLRTVGADQLRWTLLEEKARRVRKSGIRFHGIDFVAPELNGLVGESVAVRHRPHDDTSIEVFREGSHLCTALPQGALGPDERAAVLERRREDAARQARLARRATRRARERFAPATSAGPAETVTVVTATAAAGEKAGRDGDGLRRAARADLLGLPSGRAR